MNKTDKQVKEKIPQKANPPKVTEKVDKKVLPFDDGSKKVEPKNPKKLKK